MQKYHPWLLEELFINKYRSWDSVDELIIEAKKYDSKGEFARKCSGAYLAMISKFPGLIDSIFENADKYNTRDMIYIWRAEPSVYKVGITSENLGRFRIHKVARLGGFQPEVVLLKKVGAKNAVKLESKLKNIGTTKLFDHEFDGYTEFRVMTDEELGDAIDLVLTYSSQR